MLMERKHSRARSSGLSDFTCSVSSNVHQITLQSSHTSANYVIQLTGQGAVAIVHTVAPTASGFQVVLYSTSAAWATTVAQPFSSRFSIEIIYWFYLSAPIKSI